jgi:predicted DNA-binding transcriptional regulator AlpA
MDQNLKTGKKFLRLHQVLDRFQIARTSWLDGIHHGRFPKPIRIGPRTVAWREAELDELIVKSAQILPTKKNS